MTPVPAKSHTLTRDDVKLHHLDWGNEGRHPIVMVHGSNHTGMTYETTPDGREGWATYFVRKGHPVYVVDHAGRGRSGFDPTPVNAVGDKAAPPEKMPSLFLGTIERSWANFRFGPEYPKTFPNVQFPIPQMEQYLAQLVPNTEVTLAGVGRNTVEALAALLDKIGPAVIMVHSQSGVYGLDVVRLRPNLVRALVSVEGGCETVTPKDIETPFVKVPMVSVWGVGEFLLVTAGITVGGGVGTWVIGRDAVHQGGSLLALGFFGYLIARGVVERRVIAVVLAILTVYWYGYAAWGVLPGAPRISWESHLSGMLAGALMGYWRARTMRRVVGLP